MALTQRAALRSPFAAIGRVARSSAVAAPPKGALVITPSRLSHAQSMPTNSSNSASPAAHSRVKKPSRSRRGSGRRPWSTPNAARQGIPLQAGAQDIQDGAQHLAVAARRTPPFGRGLGAGNNGAARSHNSALNSHGRVRFSCHPVLRSPPALVRVVLSCGRAGACRPNPPAAGRQQRSQGSIPPWLKRPICKPFGGLAVGTRSTG